MGLSDLCQSEGPHGATMCLLPLGHLGPCGWERAPVLTRDEAGEHVRAALKLARQATNSLACIARAKYQHDAVDRLHREIDAMAALFPEGGQG